MAPHSNESFFVTKYYKIRLLRGSGNVLLLLKEACHLCAEKGTNIAQRNIFNNDATPHMKPFWRPKKRKYESRESNMHSDYAELLLIIAVKEFSWLKQTSFFSYHMTPSFHRTCLPFYGRDGVIWYLRYLFQYSYYQTAVVWLFAYMRNGWYTHEFQQVLTIVDYAIVG